MCEALEELGLETGLSAAGTQPVRWPAGLLSVKQGTGPRLGQVVLPQPHSGMEFFEVLEQRRSQNGVQGLMKALRSEQGPGISFIEPFIA